MKTPKTIEELKQWYQDMNLPPEETTRFFIGKNYEGAKAFGIYMDDATEDFVVYKNKADGTRAIRYQGKNQEYAVNELYLKLKEEVAKQKQNNVRYTTSSHKFNGGRNYNNRPSLTIGNMIIFGFVGVFIFITCLVAVFVPKRGYYLYNDNYYYYQNGLWYEYNNGWNRAEKPRELSRHYRDYYQSYGYDSYYYIDNFENSGYYIEPSSSSDDDWDSGSSWDSSDSWDSGSTDWSSDW